MTILSEASQPDWWPELAPVREAASQGRLTLGRCTACDQVHYYPRLVCPFCLEPARFEQASGEGVIYSLSVLRRGAGAPSAVAYVALAEGVSILARMGNCDFDALRIGDVVRLAGIDSQKAGLVPIFTPYRDFP